MIVSGMMQVDAGESGGGELFRLHGHLSALQALAFCHTGHLLATACNKGWLKIWSLLVRLYIYK